MSKRELNTRDTQGESMQPTLNYLLYSPEVETIAPD